MQLTILVPDNVVVVDQRPLQIDLAPFYPLFEGLHAVLWDDATGHEEFTNLMPNVTITDIDKYQPIVAAWTEEANKIDAAAQSKQTFNPTFDMGRTINQILTS
jgi:hypothetical protein